MSERPEERESTLLNGVPPAWENVRPPVPLAPRLDGYRPVYDGRPGSGTPPPNYPPPGYGSGYGYGQGYPQNNYGQPNVAEMLAVGVLMSRRRRMRRHLILWPLLFLVFVPLVLLHGCVSFLRVL